jgi:mRNA-degrading endonuclease toxin of MazEF toxin-antitoxin module
MMLNCCRGPSRPVPVFIAGGAETGHERGDFGRTLVPFLPVPVLASTGLVLMSSEHVRTGVWRAGRRVRRGEIRVIHSRVTGREQHALIIGNDALNESESTAWIITAPIDTSGASPDLLVTVRISDPVVGVIRLDSVTSVRKDRVGKLAGRLHPDILEQVAIALRAAADL